MTYIGIITGAVAGFLYWKFVGCESGTCPITSNKYISITYGAILGSLLFSTIAGATTKNDSKNSFLSRFFNKDSNTAYSNISEKEMLSMTADSNYIVIDVRTPAEVQSGYIPGTDLFINFSDPNFEAEIQKLDTSKNYILYCRSGNRSAKASKIMHKKGFNHLYNLSEGVMKWNGELKKD